MRGGERMDFEKIGGSSNIVLWILLLVIVFGFGKSGDILGIKKLYNKNPIDDNHSRKHYKSDVNYHKSSGIPGLGIGGLGGIGVPGSIGGLFGGNLIFIIVVVALLLLCKDGKKTFEEPVICEDVDEEVHEDVEVE